MTLLSLMSICRNIELMLLADGEPAAKIVARRDLINRIGQGTFYLAAAAVAGTYYYSTLSNGTLSNDSHRFLLGSGGLCSNLMGLLGDFASTCGLHIRNLTEDPDYD